LSNKKLDTTKLQEKHFNSPVYQNYINAKYQRIGGGAPTFVHQPSSSVSGQLRDKHLSNQISMSNNSLYQANLVKCNNNNDPTMKILNNYNVKSEYSYPSDNRNLFAAHHKQQQQQESDIKFTKSPSSLLLYQEHKKIVSNKVDNKFTDNHTQVQRAANLQQNIFPLYNSNSNNNNNLSNQTPLIQQIHQLKPSTQAPSAAATATATATAAAATYSLKPASNAQITRILAATPSTIFQPNALINLSSKEENAKVLSRIRSDNNNNTNNKAYNELLVENALFIDSPIHLLMDHHKKQRLLKQQKSIQEDMMLTNNREINSIDKKIVSLVLDSARVDGVINEKEVDFFKKSFK
jgi:hypothetical protein